MVAVGVVSADRSELVLCQLGCLGVVRGGLLSGGSGGQRPELKQCLGRGRAVQVAVGDDRAVVGAAGSAVVRVQVLARPDRPGIGTAGDTQPPPAIVDVPDSGQGSSGDVWRHWSLAHERGVSRPTHQRRSGSQLPDRRVRKPREAAPDLVLQQQPEM